MEHPEIKSKLSITPTIRGAQVTMSNGYSTTAMTLSELVYSAQLMFEAADVIRRLERREVSLRGAV